MSRPPSIPPRIMSLETEPKCFVPSVAPPRYPSYGTASDTWSSYSNEKKRSSWTNLIDSSENLHSYKVNHYPKVHDVPPLVMHKQVFYGSASQLGTTMAVPLARQNGSFSTMSDIVTFQMPKGPRPVFADSSAVPVQYPPSESIAPVNVPDTRPGGTPPKRNRLREFKTCCINRWVKILVLVVLLLALIAAVVAIILTQTLSPRRMLDMMWQAPEALRGGQNTASQIQMDGSVDERVKLTLKGAAPFKGNFVVYYDFRTGKSVIIDESLKQNDRTISCFVMNIDRQNTPTFDAMIRAAGRAKNKLAQTDGWAEEWRVTPSPLDTVFTPPIQECTGARWIQLDRTITDQQKQKCTECQDFCLPEFGISGSSSDGSLNIVRRNCFSLFVPEWRSYAQANTPEQHQRDFETFYRNRNTINGDASGSRWIPLAGVPTTQQFPTPTPLQMQPNIQPQNQQYAQSQPAMQPYAMNQNGMNGFASSNQMGGSVYQNGMGGGPGSGQGQMSGQSTMAMNPLGNLASDLSQGAQSVYRGVQQGVDAFGNLIGTGVQQAQNGISGIVNLPSSNTNSAFGRNMGYGTSRVSGTMNGGLSNTGIDWGMTAANGQRTYPGGILQSTNLEAGIPGVNNPTYYNSPNANNRMGDLSGYAPDMRSNIASQRGGDSRQGVVGIAAPSSLPSTGYVPDVQAVPPPSPTNTLNTFGRG